MTVAARTESGGGIRPCERERVEEGESTGKSEREARGCVASPGASREMRQAGGGRGAWPHAPGACPCPPGARKGMTGTGQVGRPSQVGGSGKLPLSGFLFIYVFYFLQLVLILFKYQIIHKLLKIIMCPF